MFIQLDLNTRLESVTSYISARSVLDKLTVMGFKTYFAGGCVRDLLVGKTPKDIDLVTSATPSEIEKIFWGKTVPVGKQFGVILVVVGGISIEVATFRKDGDYVDGRRPERIDFSEEEEDARRRDFTINGLFYDPISQNIIDHVDGLKDLQKKELRCIGVAELRFKEDYLRILRLFRFALVLDFTIDKDTLDAAIKLKMNVPTHVSIERRQEETLKTFLNLENPVVGLKLFNHHNLWVCLSDKLNNFSVLEVLFSRPFLSEEEFWLALLWQTKTIDFYLSRLKLSRRVLQTLERAWEIKSEFDDLLMQDEGSLRVLCLDRSFFLVLRNAALLTPEDPRVIKWLSVANEYLECPPKAFITGDDLLTWFQGEQLGQMLKLLFKQQLVENWKNKSEALNWLRSHVLNQIGKYR